MTDYVDLIPLIVEREQAVMPDWCDSWGIKSAHPDLRTYGSYQWPLPGQVAECDPALVVAENSSPCPSQSGDGLCVGLSWRGMASGGIPARTLLLVAYHSGDVLGAASDKLRTPRVAVVAIVDGERLVRQVGSCADLSCANLSRANLSGADLSRANLSRAYLSRADLYGADLSRAYLSCADLSRANLSGANLSRADLSCADLSRANLSGADLSRADLSCADLSRAYLSGADLSGADLSRADLSRANLSRANLSGADLYGADLSGAIGYKAVIV